MRISIFVVLALSYSLVYAGKCPAGFIGSGCSIKAEVGGCRNLTMGEFCVGLTFPDSCDVTATFYLQGISMLSKTARIDISSDVCFKPQIPALNCGVCLSLKDVQKDDQGRIKTVCPEIKVTCPTEFKLKKICIEPHVRLSANCIKPTMSTSTTGGGTGSGDSSARCTHDADCNHGHCSGGICQCNSKWSGPKCTEADCIPLCGPGGSCTSPDSCTCKKGWSPPYCVTQESQDSQTGGNSSGSENSGKNVGLIVLGVIAVALLVLGGTITAYHFWKKRRENQRAGYDEMNDLIDDDDDDKLAFVRS